MIYLVIAVSIVGLSSADQCCAPNKWSALQTTVVGTVPSGQIDATLTESGYFVSVDYERKMISAIGGSTTNGVTNNVTTLTDYNKMKTYTVVNGKCTITDSGPFQGSCIPANATVTGQGFLGVGPGNLNVKQYMLTENNFTTYITVTNNCVPVSSTTIGHTSDGAYVMSNSGFTGLKESLLDESVFNLPAECSGNALTPDGVIIGRRGFV